MFTERFQKSEEFLFIRNIMTFGLDFCIKVRIVFLKFYRKFKRKVELAVFITVNQGRSNMSDEC